MADDIKQMAKEYKEMIKSSNNVSNNYNRIINLEEKQLDMLNALRFYYVQKPNQKKIVNYCINCIYQSLDILSKMNNMPAYKPDFRNPNFPNSTKLVNQLINTQIDIFVLIDKVEDKDTLKLKMIENTKLGLLSLL